MLCVLGQLLQAVLFSWQLSHWICLTGSVQEVLSWPFNITCRFML
mgnify:CR=1 FL=1